MPLSPKQTQEILRNLGHIPKKKLGQNFLIDGNIVKKSIELANIKPHDHIIEIGPGIGTLSESLLDRKANLYLIEKDPTLVKYLRTKLIKYKSNFNLLEGDCLVKPYANFPLNKENIKFKIISNLPYAISSPWIEKILSFKLPKTMVLMIQKEASDRYCALNQSKNFSPISIFIQSAYNIHSNYKVSPKCFFPQPKVDSKLIRLDLKDEPIIYTREAKDFIRRVFNNRRKQIISTCKNNNFKDSEKWINDCVLKKYKTNIRAEEIELSIWESLGYKL